MKKKVGGEISVSGEGVRLNRTSRNFDKKRLQGMEVRGAQEEGDGGCPVVGKSDHNFCHSALSNDKM
jgi:hypothetical protein